MYDPIGDIHGYAAELNALLRNMDSEKIDGLWQHPERKIISLGNFIDRGPEQFETVQSARSIVNSGHALAVMGNHESNSVAWAIEDLRKHGPHLLSHNEKSLKQHRKFLEQIGADSELYRTMVDWFKTLPGLFGTSGRLRLLKSRALKESHPKY